jgi:hypothetical protein
MSGNITEQKLSAGEERSLGNEVWKFCANRCRIKTYHIQTHNGPQCENCGDKDSINSLRPLIASRLPLIDLMGDA